MTEFLPEGQNTTVLDWDAFLAQPERLRTAIEKEEIFEARAVSCDAEHNLCVALGSHLAVMPRDECAIGIRDGSVKEIAVISRVNKPVCFQIVSYSVNEYGEISPILSRTRVQRRALAHFLAAFHPGDIIGATVTHLEPFGAFVDIGCGISSLIATANLSVSRIDHPSARVRVGQRIKAVIREIDRESGRFSLSQKELLGTWAENAAEFNVGCTVTGIVRSIENYGVFIELAPNLSGLAEYSGDLALNTKCAVYIKNIIPERMKIKLSVISTSNEPASQTPIRYYISDGNLRRWIYSPAGCEKMIETVF